MGASCRPLLLQLLAAVVQLSRACSPCTDEPSTWMVQNDKTCDGWTYGLTNKCNQDSSWISDRVCERSCDAAGNGYTDGGCCPPDTSECQQDGAVCSACDAAALSAGAVCSCSGGSCKVVLEVHVSSSGCGQLQPAVPAEHCFATIQEAVDFFPDNADIGNATVLVHEGVYRNSNWRDNAARTAYMSNGAVVRISNKQRLTIRAANSSVRPVVQFDGSGGLVITNSQHLFVEGLEIQGPADRITGAEASTNRARITGKNATGQAQPCGSTGCQSCGSQLECGTGCQWKDGACTPKSYSYFLGNGIAVWSGSTHLAFRNNVVHHCPGSGIRVNKGDEVVIENNVVYDNTWWTFSAPSAIVLAESLGTGSNTISGNLVFGNRNFMPFYSPDLSNLAHSGTGVAHYAEAEQDYIIDGSGVYLTRNYDYQGTFYLTSNVAYDNGINGLVVHKTNRAIVRDNQLFSNGKVTKDVEGRQNAGGLVINHSEDVVLSGNTVSINVAGDMCFQCFGTCGFTDEGGNVACPQDAGVNSQFSAVAHSEDGCLQIRSTNFISTAPPGPQYTWLDYPCAGKSDGDACNPCESDNTNCTLPSQTMTCQGGLCVEYVDPCAGVVCSARDSCHLAGSCANGVCDDPLKEDGISCGDGDRPMTCQGGSCVEPVDPCAGVVCAARDSCHLAGSCANGVCDDPPKEDGVSCGDGDRPMTCQGGSCVEPVDPCAGVVCSARDSCHAAGSCTDGVCDDPLVEDSTPCNDGDPLTTGDRCSAGVCQGTLADPSIMAMAVPQAASSQSPKGTEPVALLLQTPALALSLALLLAPWIL